MVRYMYLVDLHDDYFLIFFNVFRKTSYHETADEKNEIFSEKVSTKKYLPVSLNLFLKILKGDLSILAMQARR